VADVVILGGPNGAGKTTAPHLVLPMQLDIREFVNADEIARGLSPSPQTALDRVARRVRSGGHDVPHDVVVRRYWAGLANMRQRYLPVADLAFIYDNSDEGRFLIAKRTPQQPLVVHDATRWAMIEKATP
jgi:predicted ABC-type ATPase